MLGVDTALQLACQRVTNIGYRQSVRLIFLHTEIRSIRIKSETLAALHSSEHASICAYRVTLGNCETSCLRKRRRQGINRSASTIDLHVASVIENSSYFCKIFWHQVLEVGYRSVCSQFFRNTIYCEAKLYTILYSS